MTRTGVISNKFFSPATVSGLQASLRRNVLRADVFIGPGINPGACL